MLSCEGKTNDLNSASLLAVCGIRLLPFVTYENIQGIRQFVTKSQAKVTTFHINNGT